MRAAAALAAATATLRAAGIEAPAREARLLLTHARGGSPSDPDGAVPPAFAAAFAAAVARRAAREPMALIRGRQGFWTLDLEVSAATLIPRADSETLIEAALAAFPERRAVRRILDLGTGTGALLLAALSEFPTAFGIGVDCSPEAARLAGANARQSGLAARCAVLVGHWADALGAGEFDLVLANPPYVASAEVAALMPEVARHEPRRALDGGPDGLDAYRAIVPGLPHLLGPDGVAVLEVGLGQAEAVSRLGKCHGLRLDAVRADLGGIPRAVVLAGAKTGLGIGAPDV